MDRVLPLSGLATTAIVGTLTLTKTGTTARTATFQDADQTVAALGIAQTFTAAQTINVASGTVQTWQIAGASALVLDGSGNLGLGATPTSRISVLGQSRLGGAVDENMSNTTNGMSLKDPSANVAFAIGQAKTSSCGFLWNYNATPANASAALYTFGNANPITYSASYHNFSNGIVGIGATPTAGNGLLQLASGTTKANGIAFGADTFIYRSAAGVFKANSAKLIGTDVGFTNGAASSAGTMTNAPAVGNPTKWIPIDDNGTTRYIPAW